MLNTLKIILLTIIISLFSFNYVQALDINMNLTNTTNNNTLINNNTSQNISTFSDDVGITLNSMPETELGFENILNIVLIVIGILLILLGIAILIRLK